MRIGRWLTLSGLVVVIDQVSKWAAQAYLDPARPVPVVRGFFDLQLAHNTGAAFSLLADAGGWQRIFFVALGAVVSLGIVWWLRRLQPHERWLALGLSLVLGGAVGNLVDRIRWGHVVDFIHLYHGPWHWPTFNVADSAITVGAILLIGAELLGQRGRGKQRDPAL